MRALEEYNEETGEYCETEPFMFTRVVLMLFHIERRNSLSKVGPTLAHVMMIKRYAED
jgi:hypothetical protein